MTVRVDQEVIWRFLLRRDFAGLFNYLGWDAPGFQPPSVLSVEGATAVKVADKRGVGVWQITGVLTATERRQVDRELSRLSRERLLIFDEGNKQRWLWPEMRPSGSGYRLVEHKYRPGSRNEALLQRLAGVHFDISEEGGLTVLDVRDRVRKQFNAERVTKRFFKDFKKNHDGLVAQIEGMDLSKDRGWYGSVLLNRLMFIYFLQKKGFLMGDLDYLRNRLEMVRAYLGEDAFYGFFRRFLLPLFHEGLGSHLHRYADPRIREIIGDIPYVNGAIFDPHLLEQTHDIDIPDIAFEQIFDFFDQYRWHLDERPTNEPNEINPDVLGYVFEQYVNQKEKGAYYTKEDITGYMTSVTVIPALLDRLDLDDDPMVLPAVEPDRYIHESVSYGIDKDLPPEIAAGLDNPALRDELWFEKAAPEIGLPGETWWETIDRHRRYGELRARLKAGEIENIDEAITANLDLRQLAIDFLGMLTPIESVESAYRTLKKLTVLDPTCGSGAFLFAALDILAECYEALLDRAEDLSRGGGPLPMMLREAGQHSNPKYFIYKSVMLNNLYGVDIMHEAGEIARLRMFLKLAAQLTDPRRIEPLPDLDFNIKTGNLLVGIAHPKDAEERLGQDLIGLAKLEPIREGAAQLAVLVNEFSLAQERNEDPGRLQDMKSDIERLQESLRTQLDQYLYEIRVEQQNYHDWLDSHLPFHWFVEFPGIFCDRQGFDSVIGNPPYVHPNKITSYRWQGYSTNSQKNLCAMCTERSLYLLESVGRFSMILPISFQFSQDYRDSRAVVNDALSTRWISTYGKRPDQLFRGVQQRVIIVVGSKAERGSSVELKSTRFLRWTKEYRNFLFENLSYTTVIGGSETNSSWLKLGSSQEGIIVNKLLCFDNTVDTLSGIGDYFLYYKVAPYSYLSTFIDIPPAYSISGQVIPQPQIGSLRFSDSISRDAVFVISLSKIALLWWAISGDGFHLTKRGISSTPVPRDYETISELARFAPEIKEQMESTLGFAKNGGKIVGNYDIRKIRFITDRVDRLLLCKLGLEDCWYDLQLFNASFVKTTGKQSDLRPLSFFFPEIR